MDNDYGKPLLPNVQYCVRCCMPVIVEGLQFDEMGICQPCRSSEQKIHIMWIEREKMLRKILEENRVKSKCVYDVIVPISGGMDRAFKLHILTQHYKLIC